MSALAAEVVKLLFPFTVTVLLSVIFPVVAVAVKLPPTLDVLRIIPWLLVRAASPLVPFVLTEIAPVAARVSKVMSALAAEVVKLLFPFTVTVPLSLIFPVVAVTVKSLVVIVPKST